MLNFSDFYLDKQKMFFSSKNIKCIMNSSFFSQQMAPWRPNFPHQRLCRKWHQAKPSSPGKLVRIGMLTNLQIFCRRGKMTVLTNKHLSTSSYTQLACIDCFLASRRAMGWNNSRLSFFKIALRRLTAV